MEQEQIGNANHEIGDGIVENISGKIRAIFAEHMVKITDIKAVVGPTVTTYKVYPASGVRFTKISRIQDDIAISLMTWSVRVVMLPDCVCIEVANDHTSIVSLKSLLDSEEFRDSKAELPVAIGSDAEGNPIIIDLAHAPHILMVGLTKHGKTTEIHSLILSLLSFRIPNDVKFVFVDPKGYELSAYKSLSDRYMFSACTAEEKVVTTMLGTETVLCALSRELESRYATIASAEADNIYQYNAFCTTVEKMPYIVLVIDEFADLMDPDCMDKKSDKISNEILKLIVSLAQKGHTVGIHLVITTQKPSSKVISNIIKSNFPIRMAFRVSSRSESKTIIGTVGAERLVGKGDMIFSNGCDCTRIQGAYVTRKELEEAVKGLEFKRGCLKTEKFKNAYIRIF